VKGGRVAQGSVPCGSCHRRVKTQQTADGQLCADCAAASPASKVPTDDLGVAWELTRNWTSKGDRRSPAKGRMRRPGTWRRMKNQGKLVGTDEGGG
jgi:hypothetical protein